MSSATENEVLGVIEKAIGFGCGPVTLESSMDTVEGWDSLAHLNILVALDTRFDRKVADIKEIARARSVKAIVQLLRQNSLM